MKITHLLLALGLCLTDSVSAVESLHSTISSRIQAINLKPEITAQNNTGGIRQSITECLNEISNVPTKQNELFIELKNIVNSLAPTYAGAPMFRNGIGPRAFVTLRDSLLSEIEVRRLNTEDQLNVHNYSAAQTKTGGEKQVKIQTQPVEPKQMHDGSQTLQQKIDDVSNIRVSDERDLVKLTSIVPIIEEIKKEHTTWEEKLQLFQKLKDRIKVETITSDNINTSAGLKFKINRDIQRFKNLITEWEISVIPKIYLNPMPTQEDMGEIKSLSNGAINTKFTLNIPDSPQIRQLESSFDNRLKNYLFNHWKEYYKNDSDAQIDLTSSKAEIAEMFGNIDHVTLPVDRRKFKTDLVSKILNKMLEVSPQNANSLLEIIIPHEDSLHAYVNMEKIKSLPSFDWDALIKEKSPYLARLMNETITDYWKRVGRSVIEIYKEKVKPYIYPNNIDQILTNPANGDKLVPPSMMFSDIADAGNNADQSILDFNVGNQINDKDKLKNFYKRIYDSGLGSIAKLFGIGEPMGDDHWASWFGENDYNFTEEREEICKKVLIIFAYFNRQEGSYDLDCALMGTLAGRLTHCSDGKKSGIESTAQLAAKQFTNNQSDLGNQSIECLDQFIKKIILGDFKLKTIQDATYQIHPENVSIIASIRKRNADFWGAPSIGNDIYPYNYKFNSDYALYDYEANDECVRYCYQHIYAGPHALIDSIYKRIAPEKGEFDNTNEAKAKAKEKARTRKQFLGLASKALDLRPFKDIAESAEHPDVFDDLIKSRYCIKLDNPNDEKDYTFTRAGIEKVLFYTGYLAWDGQDNEHPLIEDWQENIRWLKTNHPIDYKEIYGE